MHGYMTHIIAPNVEILVHSVRFQNYSRLCIDKINDNNKNGTSKTGIVSLGDYY